MERKRTTWVVIGVVVLVGFATYANSLHNEALFHMTPTVYTEGVMDNSRLQNHRLLGRIFTSEFTLYTYGEYRPVGYALFALANTYVDSEVAWHLVLLAIHLINALLVFAILRALVDDIAGGALALLWAVVPVFVPLVNDINSIYVLWGIQFSLLSIWLFELYVQRRGALYLGACIVLFAVSLFTYSYGMLAIPVMVLLALFPHKWGKALVCSMVGLCLLFFLTALAGVSGLVVAGAVTTLVVIAGAASSVEGRRFVDMGKVVVAAIVLVVMRSLVAKSIGILPLYYDPLGYIGEAKLSLPLEVTFVLHRLLYTPLFLISVGLALVAGVVILFRRRAGYFLAAGAALIGIVATLSFSSWYRDEVSYWDKLAARSEGEEAEQAVQLHLAKAHIKAKNWERARALLFDLKYVSDCHEQLELHANVELGKLYEGLGKDKTAGFYYFQEPVGQLTLISAEFKKWKVLPLGDFLFRLGYLSFAENFYACAQVLDQHDVGIYKRLGKTLLYKNFFRAARKYFRLALSYCPDDPECLYYLAYLSKTLGDERAYALWRARWQETGGGGELDFQPILDSYRFDKDKARTWFSESPGYLFFEGERTESKWAYRYQGVSYVFWEIPLEVGRYLYERDDYPRSLKFLTGAHKLKPDSKEALELLVKAYQRQGNYEMAAEYKKKLEKLGNEN